MTLRPLTILQVLPKLDTGGAERVAIEICAAVTAAGHKALIAAETGPLAQAALRAGAEIVALPLATKSPLAIRRNARLLARLIRARRIDLVHAHSRAPAFSALWATRRTGTPFVTSYHGAYNETLPGKRRYNAVMAAGDRVIGVSDYVAALIRTRHGVGEDRLRVIPGGVDPIKFDPAAVLGGRMARLAADWRLPEGAPILLLPGRLTGWKGQKILIAALAKLRHRDAVAVLLGADQGRSDYVQELVKLAQNLGVVDRLRLPGATEDMPAAYMLADVVINASTDPEAFGRTIVEAQAMGRFVIATGHGGARETIIDGETGFLTPPGDAGLLAARIDLILDLPAASRLVWGQYARAAVSAAYSVATMQAAVLGVYGELLDRPAQP